MLIIAGLGNPERQYGGTRHNIGFEALDKFVFDHNLAFNKVKFRSHIAEGVVFGQKIMLLKPQTYMNRSGEAIRDALAFYKLGPENLIVIYDDTALELGEVRVKTQGSAGGHNGIKDIIYQLDTDEFARIRIGIGAKPPKVPLSAYVLSGFFKEEMEDMIKGVTLGTDALELILKESVNASMNRFNKKKKPEKNNTHNNKSESYDIGRPNYPDAFFDYLYERFGQADGLSIADIGAGTGKITKRFLEKGSRVFAVEPDKKMMAILKTNLAAFANLTSLQRPAEMTDIPSGAAQLIFCGNSYMWFDRKRVVPEFQRIVEARDKPNIIIARLGPGKNVYTQELLEIDNKFKKSVSGRTPNNSNPFKEGSYEQKTFEYSVNQSYDEFLHGCLSASHAPTPKDDDFEEYCAALKQLFDKYSVDGELEGTFRLVCLVGSVDGLVL